MFSEIKDRKSQNFQKQKKRTKNKKDSSKDKEKRKHFSPIIPKNKNSTKLPPTQQKNKFLAFPKRISVWGCVRAELELK